MTEPAEGVRCPGSGKVGERGALEHTYAPSPPGPNPWEGRCGVCGFTPSTNERMAARVAALFRRRIGRDDVIRTLILAPTGGVTYRFFTAADVWVAWLAVASADDVGRRLTAMGEIRAILAAMEDAGQLTSALEPDRRGVVWRYYERTG